MRGKHNKPCAWQRPPQIRLGIDDELIIDNFAGGGGASMGIEQALGRPVDIAINHDREAIEMHMANHPATEHYCEDVFHVNPVEVCQGRPVGLAWFSPDCKHFSKAKGGKPVSKKIRGLAWVARRWAKAVKPRVIVLENVEEFKDWGPLLENGKPCPVNKGATFRRFVNGLRELGYHVEWNEIRACDYGAPTIRKRLFLVARCDGRPIVWPDPTHGEGLVPYNTAADCMDWSIPCPSIFERKRPLAENTLRRIAKGLQKYVIESADPFIIPIAHYNGSTPAHNIREPLRTITANPKGGAFAVVSPTLIQTGYGERKGQAPRVPSLHKPLGTVVAGGVKHALVMAFLAKHYTGVVGSDLARPIGTITSVDHHSLISSHMIKLRGTCKHGQAMNEPAPTVTAGGLHLGEVRAFFIKYYGTAIGQSITDPIHTITAKHRMGVVTVRGEQYCVADIGLRMLAPRELFRAQGFPDEYIIDPIVNGKPLTKTAQVRMCGNSVSPPIARAIVEGNYSAADAGFVDVRKRA